MNIYVGNLPFRATENEVRDLFATHGEVASVKIITDRDTGESRGFGFVEMPMREQAQAAIEQLNTSSYGGQTLTVNEARPREERRPGGGGGGFRGGRGGGGGGGGPRGGGFGGGGGGRRGEGRGEGGGRRGGGWS